MPGFVQSQMIAPRGLRLPQRGPILRPRQAQAPALVGSGSLFPPDGWDAIGGATWGVDLDTDASRFVTGDASVIFLPQTDFGKSQAALFAGANLILGGPLFAVEPAHLYHAHALLMAAGVSLSDDQMTVYVKWYDSTGTDVGSSVGFVNTSSAFNSTLRQAMVWQYVGGFVAAPARATFAGLLIQRTGLAAAWMDHAMASQAPMWFGAHATTSLTTSTGVATRIPFDTEDFDVAGVFDPVNGRYTAGYHQVMDFTASVEWSGGTATAVHTLTIRKNRDTIIAKDKQEFPGTQAPIQQVRTGPVELQPGDYVEVWAVQNTGGDLSIVNGVDVATWFRGAEVGMS